MTPIDNSNFYFLSLPKSGEFQKGTDSCSRSVSRRAIITLLRSAVIELPCDVCNNVFSGSLIFIDRLEEACSVVAVRPLIVRESRDEDVFAPR